MRTRRFRLARTALMLWLIPCIIAGVGNRNAAVQAQRLESVSVTLAADGAQRQLRTAQTTVGATLKEAGITVEPLDRVSPAANERVRNGMTITLTRVEEGYESQMLPVAFETEKRFTKSLRPGAVKEARAGVSGEKMVQYRVRKVDGETVSRTKVGSVVTRKPVSRIMDIGYRGRYVSRGIFRTSRVLNMSATAYDPGPRSCGRYATGRTSCGMKAGYGVVAVDPRVIPLGTRLHVEGYGYAIAGDTGHAIRGNRIDLGFETYSEAKQFGRKRVTVHVLQD